MAHTIKYASFGPVSTGTMATEDLLNNLAYELEWQMKRQSSRFPRREFRKLVNEAYRALRLASEDDSKIEDANDVVEALFGALGEFAPPYAYFGAHSGDGADYGYWLGDLECVDLRVDDLAAVPAGYRGEVLIVNDHGNCTLGWIDSRGKFHETWSVV